MQQKIVCFICYILIEKEIWISYGGFHEKINDEKVYNTHLIVDDQGEIRSIYRKIHLFDVKVENGPSICESAITESGNEVKIFKLNDDVILGLRYQDFFFRLIFYSTCYDIRFPYLYSMLRKKGANILLVPSAFTEHTGKAHWHILLQCRAIENQCFVVAAAQYGKHNMKRTSYGHSLIVSPWGNILQDATNKINEILYSDLNLDLIEKVRKEMPVFNHIREDIK